jgi:GNAT superfamily N-acetyltransferase
MGMMLRLRPVTLDDAGAVARIRTELHADEPEDAATVRASWKLPHTTMVFNRFVAEDGGEPVGFASCVYPAAWVEGETRYGQVALVLTPAAQDSGDYDRILEELIELATESGAEAMSSFAREDDEFFIAGLERNGFRRDRLSKAWELDLEANRERLLADRSDARARMRELGVDLVAYADVTLPDKARRFYDLDMATTHDIPHTVPFVDPTFEEWLAYAKRPDLHDDRIWTAWKDGEMIGVSFLTYPVVGNVWTGYTACHRDHRGLGIARAVKMETLGQAIELGVSRVRTDNDEQNAAMLHINEALGYYRVPGFVSFLRT